MIGSALVDTLTGDSGVNSFEGGRGDDVLAGGTGIDTYVFNKGDGTDTITDSGGSIVFEQGTDNDYAGAIYTFSDVGSDARLTVTKSGSTLNVIDFTGGSSGYSFYTRSGGSDTRIPDSSFVYPPSLMGDGSEGNPYLATAAADSFTGAVDYDWVSYAESTDTAGVFVSLGADPATVSRGASGDTLSGINNLIGSGHDDGLFGNSGDNILRGGAGVDDLYGGDGADTLQGGDGRDKLSGSTGDDFLEGGAGKDDYIFYADSGNDIIRFNLDGGRILFRDASLSDMATLTISGDPTLGDVTLSLDGVTPSCNSHHRVCFLQAWGLQRPFWNRKRVIWQSLCWTGWVGRHSYRYYR